VTKSARFRCLFVVALALGSYGFVEATPQTGPAPTKALGQIEVTVSKVEQYTMVGDSFNGRTTSYNQSGYIYLHFKNVGHLPVCVSLLPSVEEYKRSELQYTQPLKTGFAYNPKIENLNPGRETSGYYDFQPSPQKRSYDLILQQAAQTQKCGAGGKTNNATTSEGPSVRFPLSENTKPH
jgi:hypothetical protein